MLGGHEDCGPRWAARARRQDVSTLTHAHIRVSGSSRPRPARQVPPTPPAALPPVLRPLPLPLASTRRAVWDSTPVRDRASRPKRVALPSGHQARTKGGSATARTRAAGSKCRASTTVGRWQVRTPVAKLHGARGSPVCSDPAPIRPESQPHVPLRGALPLISQP